MKWIKRAKAEKNNGQKLTIPVHTRTPLEAFRMLEVGQPVDVLKGYYEGQGVEIDKDFQLMDHIEKLKQLNHYRSVLESRKSEFENLQKQYESSLQSKGEGKEQSKGEGKETSGEVSK